MSSTETITRSFEALREKYLGYIIAHQASSGWIGLDDMPKDGNQYWSRINIVLSLIQYYEGSQDAAAMCVYTRAPPAQRPAPPTLSCSWR